MTDCSLQGGARLKPQNPYFEVVGSSSSVLGRNGFDACFELGHFNLQQGALCTVFEAPYDTQISRPSDQIASLASAYSDRTQVQTYENPKLKAAVTEVH